MFQFRSKLFDFALSKKQRPLKGAFIIFWCRGRDLNPHGPNDRMALNHVRLPIPPPRHKLFFVIFAIYYTTQANFRQEPFLFFTYKSNSQASIFPIKNERLCARTYRVLERVTGFEPATPCLASKCSTAELHPLGNLSLVREEGFEPSRDYQSHWILSPARLPIPPLSHLSLVTRAGFEPATP